MLKEDFSQTASKPTQLFQPELAGSLGSEIIEIINVLESKAQPCETSFLGAQITGVPHLSALANADQKMSCILPRQTPENSVWRTCLQFKSLTHHHAITMRWTKMDKGVQEGERLAQLAHLFPESQVLTPLTACVV